VAIWRKPRAPSSAKAAESGSATSTLSTRASEGPRLQAAQSASTASARPAKTASTSPFKRFRTHPDAKRFGLPLGPGAIANALNPSADRHKNDAFVADHLVTPLIVDEPRLAELRRGEKPDRAIGAGSYGPQRFSVAALDIIRDETGFGERRSRNAESASIAAPLLMSAAHRARDA